MLNKQIRVYKLGQKIKTLPRDLHICGFLNICNSLIDKKLILTEVIKSVKSKPQKLGQYLPVANLNFIIDDQV